MCAESVVKHQPSNQYQLYLFTAVHFAAVGILVLEIHRPSYCAFSFLHGRLRTCTLRSDHEGQSTLTNLLLRNYLAYNLYDQADKLVSKTTFPEAASNNEWARYLFYLGKMAIIVGT